MHPPVLTKFYHVKYAGIFIKQNFLMLNVYIAPETTYMVAHLGRGLYRDLLARFTRIWQRYSCLT